MKIRTNKVKWYNRPPFVYMKYKLYGFVIGYRAAKRYWKEPLCSQIIIYDKEVKG